VLPVDAAQAPIPAAAAVSSRLDSRRTLFERFSRPPG
jgi:hypothetical protein